MFRPGARSKKILLVLTALVVMVAVASLMVTPAFAAASYELIVPTGTNLLWVFYNSSGSAQSNSTLSNYVTRTGYFEDIGGVNYTSIDVVFNTAYNNSLRYAIQIQPTFSTYIEPDPGWDYWKITFSASMNSGLPWTYFDLVRIILTPDGSSSTYKDATRVNVKLVDGFYYYDYILNISDYETFAFDRMLIGTSMTAARSFDVGYQVSVKVSPIEIQQISSVEYQQLEQMQQSNQIQQGISDTLNNGTQANQNANQQGSQAADNFNNTVGDYSDLNNALDKPEAGADFSTDFGEITQDAYNASFVASTLGALYDNPAIIYSMLLTASFCVLGYILYGKRI